MSRLDLKLLRDLRALKSQALAVALVMACGLAMMIMARSLILSLETARDTYYRECRFAQVFANLKRAPNAVTDQLAAIPGVGAVETSIAISVTLDLPDMEAPAMGQINSLPEQGELQLNRLHLRRGRLIRGPDARGEVLVSEAFAEAHHLQPGDSLAAVLNGRKQSFRIAGTVLAPQYVFEAMPGVALPDHRSFGVIWMPYRELANALNLYGAFNQVDLTLAPGASESGVISAINNLLALYGIRTAYGRQNHASDSRLRDELRTLQVLAIGFPVVFLSVAAFMVGAVMNRQITLQRDQIAILKAFGFSNGRIGRHYLKFALVIVVLGTATGTAGGIVLGHRLVEMYHLFFRFPDLPFLLDTRAVLLAGAASAAAALIGVWGSVRTAMRLAPAQAMRPEPPASFRPSPLERTALGPHLPATLRICLRNLSRRPWRAVFTCLALALATGILIVPNTLSDGISYVLNFQWDILQRNTVIVALAEPAAPRALHDLGNLPGVTLAEPYRSSQVEFTSGSHRRLINVIGFRPESTLNRLLDAQGHLLTLPPHGLVVSAKLAEVLGVRPGEKVLLHFREGTCQEVAVPIALLSEDFAGVVAYLDLDELNRLIGEGDRISGAHLVVSGGQWREFLRTLKDLPAARGVVIKDAMRDSFRDTTAQTIGLLRTIYLIFATVVAFSIVYNSARIALSERQRELATLRVLGFTRREVAGILVGELALLTVAALPLGLLLGTGFAAGLIYNLTTEYIRLPLIITASNLAYAVLVVALASLVSGAFSCRHLNRLDLVGALKAAE